MHAVRVPLILLVVGLMASVGGAKPADPPKPKPKLTKWIINFDAATLLARKEKKIILAYFCSSDGEPYTQELEKHVLNTDLFRDWATEHVILFQADYPRDKQLSLNNKAQNERLKARYSIIKVPTFILMDYSGLPFARASFDEAKLRDDEAKDQPKAWIKYLEDTIKNRPPDEELVRQKSFRECIGYAKKHFLSAVLLINQGRNERDMATKDDLIHNQQFVKFINLNVSFIDFEWPADSDTSPDSTLFREWAVEQNLEPAGLELIIWDMQTHKVNFRLKAIDPSRAENIISLIEGHLPKIDYSGGWIEDFHQAKAIAQQQKNRYVFLAFTSMDSSEYSRKMYDEIFRTDEFKKYARKHLVTVDVDFPTATTQPTGVQSQNKTLAETYAIRGFPSVIVLNPVGQKIADAKYSKGGPEPFLKQLEAAIKVDESRRAYLAGEQ